MEIYLARIQGFCAGVASAIETVERALAKYGTPLYVFHEIVHNTSVVERFRARGVIFVDDIEKIPHGSRVIFSAHGVAPSVVEHAKTRKLKYIDATCPLVTKVHREAANLSKKGIVTILIGHRNHEELVGTAGYVDPKLLWFVNTQEDIKNLNIDSDKPVGYITQTTLSSVDTAALIAQLKEKFPKLISPPKDDICCATQNRQDAVRELAKMCDMIIICGSKNSSNSNRLKETAEKEGVRVIMIDTADDFNPDLLEGHCRVGISSGASVPRMIVDALIKKIQTKYPDVKIHTAAQASKEITFTVPEV
ncbi:MAG TPA: 4-hydroxy-3-methylbut-2-enyl diphosphate reductase [Candidatus Omnitrophota bacterium]|nr:4-hydroxy-3-methylbut-2-enyl diphosphate reductase [Candidatus Omnitrophota bacterium]HPD85365.1 4-hydroxy-3-methylbut-2-enyl diphosphate reductase [Candidatus Omnitrophota bacterium]HRZ04134.1 4-hydroxy-3-methylbut-2-enyl diphosphate reductase [Candidatus Omnitrophota bacterium]